MAANRSSELNLFALEDQTDDSYKVQMATTITDFELSGPQSAKFDFAAMEIKDGGSYYNLTSRIAAAESQQSGDQATLLASVQQNAADIAQGAVDRTSGDVGLQNQITAEISSRTTSVQAVQDALSALEIKQADDDTSQAQAVAAEASSRTQGLSAEAAARASQVAGLQQQITNLLGNSTPEGLQSLSAIVQAFQGQDVSHTSAISSLVTRMDAVEALLEQTLNVDL